MKESISPLQEVLASLREDEPPIVGARERIRSRLAERAPDIDRAGGGTIRAPSIGSRETPRPSVSRHPYRFALATFALGAVVGAAFHAAWSPTRPLSMPPAWSVRASGPTDMPLWHPLPERASPEDTPQAAPVDAGVVGAPRARSDESQLDAERRLLDQARAAMVRGDFPASLDQLRRHQRAFPNGLLSEERDALRIEVLCRAGRYDDARRLAQEFRARSPGSLFEPMVRSALDSIPVTDRPTRVKSP